jgi:hypothetical protein
MYLFCYRIKTKAPSFLGYQLQKTSTKRHGSGNMNPRRCIQLVTDLQQKWTIYELKFQQEVTTLVNQPCILKNKFIYINFINQLPNKLQLLFSITVEYQIKFFKMDTTFLKMINFTLMIWRATINYWSTRLFTGRLCELHQRILQCSCSTSF